MAGDDKNRHEKLIATVRDAIQRDNALREKYHVSEKFRFIKDKLQHLLSSLEKNLVTVQEEAKPAGLELAPDESMIYVHLFNAKGSALASWQNMLTPKVLYEYSVNRPVYIDKAHIDALIRTKTNKLQHAYLTIIIKQRDLIQPPSDSSPKDAIGNPIVKVREGSLKFENLVKFTHNLIEYDVDSDGVITPISF